jgi:hypothetical protein
VKQAPHIARLVGGVGPKRLIVKANDKKAAIPIA